MRAVLSLCGVLFLAVAAWATTGVTSILVDTSGSIPVEDFQKARVLIQDLLTSAGPDEKIAIYAFGNDLRKVTPEELSALRATESNTMLFDAAYEAARELEKENAERKSIVIISDGIDTKSATILEDTADYVNQHGITVYGIGVGNTQRKSLERLSRLTGGKFYPIDTPDLVAGLRAAQDSPKPPEIAATPEATPAPTTGAKPNPVQPPASKPVTQKPPAPAAQKPSYKFFWYGGALGGVVFLIVLGWIVTQAFKKDERTCPNCGRVLESYQTVCPSCPGGIIDRRTVFSPDSTQELNRARKDPALFPADMLEKRPVTEEMLSKTFVLMETPLLVIRKGVNIGRSFSLNRVYPVSIGRSRVNEIKVEDVTVSSQHCKIIPENGRHVLYDLESTNGTFVNDKRVAKVVLSEGDIIKVGETQFLFKLEQQRN